MAAQQSTEKNVRVSGDKHEDVMQNVRFVLYDSSSRLHKHLILGSYM